MKRFHVNLAVADLVQDSVSERKAGTRVSSFLP